MARKKRGSARKTTKSAKTSKGPVRLRDRVNLAWRNLVLFLIIFIFSLLLYLVSSNDLLKNFFGIIAIIFGFLTFAFLIVFIVLFILKKARK